MSPDVLVAHFRANAAAPSQTSRAAARERLLVAIASHPLARTHGSRRGPRRLGIAAVAIAVATGAALLPRTGDGASVVERAEAALAGPTRILHVVVTISDSTGITREEGWVRTDGSRGRTVTLEGTAPSDCVGSETQLRCYEPATNTIHVYTYHPDAISGGGRATAGYHADDPASLAAALRSGYARDLGRATFAGRDAYAIELAIPHIAVDGTTTPGFAGANPILYLDPDTYLPIGQRFPDVDSTTRYDTYRFLPDTRANAARLELPAPANATTVRHPVGEGPSR